MRRRTPVPLILLIAALPGCTGKNQTPAPRPIVRVNGQEFPQDAATANRIAQPPQRVDQALKSDPRAARLHDISGALLEYYALQGRLPARLEDLQPLAEVGRPLLLTSPADDRPLVYTPAGLRAANDGAQAVIVHDPAPDAAGNRWAILMQSPKPRQPPAMWVVPLKRTAFEAYAASPAAHDPLTTEQRKGGWRSLFDGKSLAGWRGYRMKEAPPSWEAKNGAIFCNGKDGTDLVTTETFGDFELALEWKISVGGNSGVHLRATETTPDTASNAIEIQVIDTSEGWKTVHGYALSPGNSAGAIYGLYDAKPEAIRAAGEWNTLRVRVAGTKLRVEQNGVVIADTDMAGEDWQARLTKGKFANFPQFNKAAEGHIALQNYRGAGVWYRNVILRPIAAERAKAKS